MKENKASQENIPLPKNSIGLVPEEFLDNLITKQDRIIGLLEGKSTQALNDYITEKQAMEMLNKKATWFWQMRKSNKLSFKKIGQTIYYSKDDLQSLLQNNK